MAAIARDFDATVIKNTGDKEVPTHSIDSDKWCGCIDGALTKENYLASIRKAGFQDPQILEEKLYQEVDGVDSKKITSLVIKAVK
jgi:arsenite methyltransferase